MILRAIKRIAVSVEGVKNQVRAAALLGGHIHAALVVQQLANRSGRLLDLR